MYALVSYISIPPLFCREFFSRSCWVSFLCIVQSSRRVPSGISIVAVAYGENGVLSSVEIFHNVKYVIPLKASAMCTWWRVNEKICSFQCTGPWGTRCGIRCDGRNPSSFEPSRVLASWITAEVCSHRSSLCSRGYVLHISTSVKQLCFSSRGKFCFINFIERTNPTPFSLAFAVEGASKVQEIIIEKAIVFAGTITTYKAPTDEPVCTQHGWAKRLGKSFTVSIQQPTRSFLRASMTVNVELVLFFCFQTS